MENKTRGMPAMFTLDNGILRVRVSDYGASLYSIDIPTSRGTWFDVLLGPETQDDNRPYFGSSIGRFANRIAGASFELDGARYDLSKNEAKACLHGGASGFDKRIWDYGGREDNTLTLSLRSPDGDQGFPGALNVTALFALRGAQLRIEYKAVCDKSTPLSITNHAYFNLSGAETVAEHELKVYAKKILVCDKDHIPTRETPRSVVGSDMDFLQTKPLAPLLAAGGLDHCYLFEGKKELRTMASLYEPKTRRRLSVISDMPALQVYTGNFLEGVRGKSGSVYKRHAALCLEPEYYPDSPNRSDFPDCILRPAREYSHTIVYDFEIP